KDQVLLTLDTRQERAQLASAEAGLELARLSLDRSKKLLAQNAIAQSEFDLVSAQYKQAEAAAQEMQASIDRKTIRAPFAVIVGTGDAVVALPTSAINYAPYGNSVFIIEDMKGPDGKSYRGVRQQFVKLGRSQGDQVAVIDGVQPGQEVVTSGVFKLRPGASVQVNNKTQPSNSPWPRPEDG